MWTAEEDRQLTENWLRAESKRKEEALAHSSKLASAIPRRWKCLRRI